MLRMGTPSFTRADSIRELLKVFKILGRPFSRRDFDEVSEVPSRTIERHFGTWGKALLEAGLAAKFKQAKEVEKEKTEFHADNSLAEHWKVQKAELLKKAEDRKIRMYKEQLQKMDHVREMILESVAKAEPPLVEVTVVKEKPKSTAAKPHCTLWFEFSDLQLGTLMTSESMGGLNKHNWVIWQQKLSIWKDRAKSLIERYRKDFHIDHIVINCCGDMVEGQDIFGGQVWQIDRHVVDQAIQGANDTAGAFLDIFLSFPELEFHILEVFGNHGRVQKKGDSPHSCSMDKVYQRMLQSQLVRVGKLNNLTYHENEAWFYLLDLYGRNHIILHGDQGMSGLWSSRPTVNGLEKGIARYSQMLQQPVHFLHAGHFHQSWQLSFNMSSILINGSFIGTSQFSASKMVAASPPLQVMHVFEPLTGLSKSEQIYLSDGATMMPLEPKRLRK